MNSYRLNAILMGVLFLIALILNLIASGIIDPILTGPDYLTQAFPNKDAIITGNLLNFICAIAMIFIPIILYPVVQKNHKNLAQVYIVGRALEGILFIYLVIKSLSLISLSKVYINADPQIVSNLETLGHSIHAESQWATIVDVIIFCLGAMAFYSMLYKSKLVPHFLSAWGFLAVSYLLVGSILGLYGTGIFSNMPFMEAMIYFAPPIALNEFVLGIWLIVKGFNPPATDTALTE